MLVLTLEHAYKVRCAECAGEPEPDLPPLTEQAGIQPSPLTRFSNDMLPLDFKQKASGED